MKTTITTTRPESYLDFFHARQENFFGGFFSSPEMSYISERFC